MIETQNFEATKITQTRCCAQWQRGNTTLGRLKGRNLMKR